MIIMTFNMVTPLSIMTAVMMIMKLKMVIMAIFMSYDFVIFIET